MRILAIIFLATGSLYSQEDEIASIEHLIAVTQKNLQTQNELKEKMLRFSLQKQRFAQGEQSKQHASLMVHTAYEIYETIKEYRLQYLFTSHYLEELALFSSIAKKSTPSRP